MYRTQTNVELNRYRARLDVKLQGLIDRVEKQYKVNDFIIFTEQKNLVENPNGSWKWNGWKIVGQEYKVSMYHETECELNEDGKYHPITWCQKMLITKDVNEANKTFVEFRTFAKNF